jgi:hypothetical protein
MRLITVVILVDISVTNPAVAARKNAGAVACENISVRRCVSLTKSSILLRSSDHAFQ